MQDKLKVIISHTNKIANYIFLSFTALVLSIIVNIFLQSVIFADLPVLENFGLVLIMLIMVLFSKILLYFMWVVFILSLIHGFQTFIRGITK